MSATTVKGMMFVLVYADKLEPVKEFYEKYLGFEQTAEFRPGEIYGKLGATEMWIGSGYERSKGIDKSIRINVMVNVDSVGSLFDALKKDGQKLIQDEPIEMQPGTFWLQFEDLAGNIVEVLGQK